MTHYTKQQWDLYSKGLTTPHLAEQMEDHMLECEHCLIAYADQAEQLSVPAFSAEEAVMAAIAQDAKVTSTIPATAKTKPKRKTAVHFFISAAAALMLASTGVFSSIIEEPTMEQTSFTDSPSITSTLLEQTDKLFAQMDPSRKEVNE